MGLDLKRSWRDAVLNWTQAKHFHANGSREKRRNRRCYVGAGGGERLEPRSMLTGVVISEFMASNGSILTDEDGEFSDWIELHNTGDEPVSLNGWFLTDNDNNLTKWQFPDVTINADSYLVVFADDKDRRVPGSNLHTNFKLGAEGEFLGLVRADGVTLEHFYADPYPTQQTDISYGIGEGQIVDTLVDASVPAKFIVPTASTPTGDWKAPEYDDSGWTDVVTGVGYQNIDGGSAVSPVGYWRFDNNVDDLSGNNQTAALRGAATYSADRPSQLGTGSSLSLNGTNGTFVEVNPMNVSETGLAVSMWFKGSAASKGLFTVAQGANGAQGLDRALYLSGTNIVSQLRGGVSTETIISSGKTYNDNAWHHVVYTFEQGVTTQRVYVDGVQVAVGTQSASLFTTQDRIFIGYAPQAFQDYWTGLIDDVAIFNGSLSPTQVTALYNGASPLELQTYEEDIVTDVGADLDGVNASSYLRVPFGVTDVNDYDGLKLQVKYDDGFVAYLNGTEVARRNAPASLAWNSAATTSHFNGLAAQYENIDITAHLSALRPGLNVLAFQGLNVDASNIDFLLSPKLIDEDTTGSVEQYYALPTPGGPNNFSGTEIVTDPLFSQGSSIITAATQVTITTSTPGATIRYTTNGSVPTEASPAYTAPINVTTTTQIRARAFKDGARPSNVSSQFFTMLAADALSFSSNLPLIVVDSYGQSFNSTTLTPVTAHFLEDPGNRTTLTSRQDVAMRAGMRIRGQSSEGFAKKQYAFETWDESSNDDRDYSIFGLPEESDWIFYGPYSEKAMIQNAFVYELSNEIGDYAVRTHYVEMFLNTDGVVTASDYIGLYILMEKIKVDDNRVDISPIGPNNNTGAAVTGGYLFSFDKNDPGETDWITTSRGYQFHMLTPDFETEATAQQKTYLTTYMNSLETALYGANFTNPTTGYAAYLDPQTFINHHLLVELAKNIDGYRISTYYNKDRDGKVKMGPVWDYNLSLSNANYLTGWDPSGWYDPLVGDGSKPYFTRLFQDSNFAQGYVDSYFKYRESLWTIDRLMDKIDDHIQEIYEAAQREHARWGTLGNYLWPNIYFGQGDAPHNAAVNNHPARTYRDEVQVVRQWLHDRMLWMDSQWLAVPKLSQDGGEINPGFQLSISGNLAVGKIYYTTDGTDPRAAGGGISPSALEYTGSITLNGNTKVIARLKNNATTASLEDDWSAPETGIFVTDAPDLIISEIMYNPANPGSNPGGFERDDYEFVEVTNVGSTPLNVNGYKFTSGISYTFPNVVIGAGESRVIARNATAFANRYPGVTPLAGNYIGTLDDAGEGITLVDNVGVTLFDGKYESDWEPHTDGDGYSLVTTYEAPDGGALFNVGDASDKWRASQFIHGNPGATDGGVQTNAVVINEVMANGGDWIELYNRSSSTIDLGGWYLSDDSTNLTKYRIAAGTAIAAGGFLVFTQADDFGSVADPGTQVAFGLSEFGESVFLTSPGAGNLPGGYRFSEGFGATDPGVSIGRYIKSNGKKDFVILSNSTPGGPNSGGLSLGPDDAAELARNFGKTSGATQAQGDFDGDGDVDLADVAILQANLGSTVTPAAPTVGPVVISEVMYHPAEHVLWLPVGAIKDEFIEIQNISSSTVSLFDPANPANTWRISEGVDFTFPTGQTLAAGARALIVPIAPATFRTKYSIPASVQIFGPYNGNLDNGGEEIELLRPGTPVAGEVPYIRVDRLQYEDESPWSEYADGVGSSLARIDVSAYGNDVANWAAGRAGGTPGAANTFIDLTPPDQVQNVVTSLTGVGTVNPRTNVAWSPSSDAESNIAYYKIYRKGSATVSSKAQPIFIGTSTTTTFVDNTVFLGPTFTYLVSAVNRDGVEGPRSELGATKPVAVSDSYVLTRDTNLVTVVGADTPQTLIAAGSVWKYKDDGSNQGTAWRAQGFDDSTWKSGPAVLGYGDGDEATVVDCGPAAGNECSTTNNPAGKYATTYFRRTFSVTNPAELTSALLRIKRDDGVRVFINGTEVVREGFNPLGVLGDNTIAYNTYSAIVAGDDGANFIDFPIGTSALVNGTNTIGVEIHQESGTSSDISFDLIFEVTRRRAGLLFNDVDPEGDPLTAIKVTDPANGQLTVFNTNGTFTYVPNPGFTGTDSFTYKVRDPAFNESTVVTVSINVIAPSASPPASPASAIVARAPRVDAVDAVMAAGRTDRGDLLARRRREIVMPDVSAAGNTVGESVTLSVAQRRIRAARRPGPIEID